MSAAYSFSLAAPGTDLSPQAKLGLGLVGASLLTFLVAAFGAGSFAPVPLSVAAFGLITVGGLIYFRDRHLTRPEGVLNDGLTQSGWFARGVPGWILGIVLTGFYVLVYWVPDSLYHLTRLTDGLSYALRGLPADHWFLYGTFYTLAVALMGVRAVLKYRHSRYQILRTLSVVFFQTILGFVLPGFLRALNQPEYYFHYFWPLKQEYLFPDSWSWLVGSGGLGAFMFFWGIVGSFVLVPVLTYFFGKRWYCSWVCGCGALAETAGDSFRQLSDKSLKAWRIERWMIYSVLVIITLGTVLLWLNSTTGGSLLGGFSSGFSRWYGFFIGSIFAGVIGVGFYPLMGTRVWCRFGCPMAAYLGILQKYFSRFRITTNGGQCISCGNCSKYCEMGIDVRWYAQRGQNIIRASCVGCGICSTVCPRGVLNLENGSLDTRYNGPELEVKLDVITRPRAAG